MNMSYCRFQNTQSDLRDCKDALEAVLNGEGALSNDELAAAKKLAKHCADILQNIADYAAKDVSELINDEDEIDNALEHANVHASDEEN